MTRSRLLTMIVLAGSLSALCGCAMSTRPAWLGRPTCQISPTISKDALVAHLNGNIQGSGASSGLASWRSTNCKITATGMPPGISVPASIAVEAPRNFRLRVSEPLTRNEALDMGSNDEQFWIWAKDAQPSHVVTCSHQKLPRAQRELRIPFHPDWLMQVMGVIPLDAEKFTLNRSRADAPILELVSERMTTSGEPERRVIRIDACQGYIREHALYDGRGVLVARAALANHRRDESTGLVVPHVISFDWPGMKQHMKMSFATVDLNPPQMPDSAWEVPHKPGYPHLDLGEFLTQSDEQPSSLYGADSPFGPVPPTPTTTPIEESVFDRVSHEDRPTRQAVSVTPVDWANSNNNDSNKKNNASTQTAAESPWFVQRGGERIGVSRDQLTTPTVTTPTASTSNVTTPTVSSQPSEYSPAASQSSSGRRRRGRALWRLPSR